MISVRIEGDAAVIQSLERKVPALTEAVRNSVTRMSIALLRHVKENKLSGQVLKVRSGTLRRKVNFKVTETPTEIRGDVGVKLSYAAAHEFGLDTDESVREHLRTIKKAFGKPINPVTFSVRAHTRHIKLPERSFLRSALRDMGPEITSTIATAVEKAAKQ